MREREKGVPEGTPFCRWRLAEPRRSRLEAELGGEDDDAASYDGTLA
jgi:hypothetical protein